MSPFQSEHILLLSRQPGLPQKVHLGLSANCRALFQVVDSVRQILLQAKATVSSVPLEPSQWKVVSNAPVRRGFPHLQKEF